MTDNNRFELAASDPGLLRQSARGELYVADVLGEAFQELRERGVRRLTDDDRYAEVALFRAESYHRGLTLELAAKAALAEKTGTIPPHHHRIEDLCREAGIELSHRELELVRRLAEAVVWWGRYGAPKTAAHFERAERDGLKRRLPDDRQILAEILERLGCVEPTD